jgi:hypothetical protein
MYVSELGVADDPTLLKSCTLIAVVQGLPGSSLIWFMLKTRVSFRAYFVQDLKKLKEAFISALFYFMHAKICEIRKSDLGTMDI